MTAVTHLVTCRQKRGRLQAYLGGEKQRDVNAHLSTNDAGFQFHGHTQTFIRLTIGLLMACRMVAGLKTFSKWS